MDFLTQNNVAPLPIDTLAINMLLGLLLSGIVSLVYVRFGQSFSNRSRFAQLLPVLALITILVISVVKSSLALSLGLVGALSIVRFRTAIKEPEELIYLFLAIAIGLGLGADQRAATLVAIAIILGFLLARAFFFPAVPKNNLYLNVYTAVADTTLTQINQLLTKHITTADLRRVDKTADSLQATYLIKAPDETTLTNLLTDLQEALPQGEFSFIEQDSTLGG